MSIGKIGQKLVESVANYTDVLREGPEEPYYFGLTTPAGMSAGTSATFGVNCDMPGLHFEDTCVTDADCDEFPDTTCQAEPVNAGLDPGTRRIPFIYLLKNSKECTQLRIFQKEIKLTLNQELMHI